MFGAQVFGEGPFAAPLPPWRAVLAAEGQASLVARGAGVGGSVAGGVATGMLAVAALAAVNVTVQSSALGALAIDGDAVTSVGEVPPVIPAPMLGLAPLAASHEADQLEAELKAIFMQVFEGNLRPLERFINALGMPQHGPIDLVEQAIASEGLAIYSVAASGGAGSYLLRSWRAHNPKRGLHLLKAYLQLMWPNVWTVSQMWQQNGLPYPTALSPVDGGNHFLTSRVHVSLPSRATTGADLQAISSGLRAALPARMVLNLSVTTEEAFDMGLAAAAYRGMVTRSYEGNFK